jgi:hypothetical protein
VGQKRRCLSANAAHGACGCLRHLCHGTHNMNRQRCITLYTITLSCQEHELSLVSDQNREVRRILSKLKCLKSKSSCCQLLLPWTGGPRVDELVCKCHTWSLRLPTSLVPGHSQTQHEPSMAHHHVHHHTLLPGNELFLVSD